MQMVGPLKSNLLHPKAYEETNLHPPQDSNLGAELRRARVRDGILEFTRGL